MKKKIALMATSLVLVVAMAVGGTLAYLTAQTKAVTNTFVVGNIGTLALQETDPDSKKLVDANDQELEYLVIPGKNIVKDPQVTFTKADEEGVPVYVFVKVTTGSDWINTGSAYAIATNNMSWSVVSDTWTKLMDDGGSQVYYRALGAEDQLTNTRVMTGDAINVSGNITNEELSGLENLDLDIVFQAYAIQQESFNGDVSAAWAAVKN